MPTERFAGTSGRLILSFVDQTTEDADGKPTDVPDFTVEAGDAQASILKWEVADTKDGGTNRLYTYDSPITSDAVVYPELTLGGTGYWTATVEAVVDRDEIEDYFVGRVLVADFVYKRSDVASQFGHHECGGVISNVRFVTGIDSRTAMLSISIDGDGAFPPPS